MKKIFFLGLFFVLISALVFAVGENAPMDTGNLDVIPGEGSPEELPGNAPEDTGNAPEDTGQGLMVETSTETQQQNMGEETQIQNQVQVRTELKAGEYTSENGQQVKVQEETNNRIKFNVGTATALTAMKMNQEQTAEGTKLTVKLSNGADSEVKVMPDTASEKALEQLRLKVCSEENGCTIELKEVGKGEEVKAAYEVQAKKEAKFLGLFKTQMQVKAQVDAENGEVIKTQKPWWAFLASESSTE